MSNTELFEFIKKSPDAYHAVENIKTRLISAGYTEISECDLSAFSDGGAHFVVRGGSSVIAFRGSTDGGFMITASHSDNPSFKVKENVASGAYAKLNTEKYGGMILYSWLDRPLSVAGRVTVRTRDGIASRLVNIDRDYALIPSVAIHLNRGVNDGYKFNPATDMLPLTGISGKASLMADIAKLLGVGECDIISHDLHLYNREEPRAVGGDGELILSPRIDDLGCVWAALEGFLTVDKAPSGVSVLAVFDNEEVGSSTKQGANSTFLADTLRKIAGNEGKYYQMLSDSYMVSCDVAHAKHPNHPELSDSVGAPTLGGGVAVKYNANQSYTTDSVSDGIIRTVAERCGAKLQSFYSRADMPCGSTLGSISDTRVSVSSVDIGIPQLAMHSATETAAAADIDGMISLLKELYSSTLAVCGDEVKILK